MSGAPLAPTCRHCGATNDAGASECWLCQRRDWREDPKPRRRQGAHLTPAGCMVLFTIALIAIVAGSFRVGRIVGLASLVVGALAYAVAIALFLICSALGMA
jgi:MFS superfamily sulfate permease-like transporter